MSNDSTTFPFRVTVVEKRWLSEAVFELHVEKPPGFAFLPGQKVSCLWDGQPREYTLVSAPGESTLAFCVRAIPGGVVSSALAGLHDGDMLSLSSPYGFFRYRSANAAVFVATGTGIAPFVAFSKTGVTGFILLHGVRRESDLYYRDILEPAAARYIPCLSGDEGARVPESPAFAGRVTTYMSKLLPAGVYDFYLCGNGEMIREAMEIVDRHFPQSKVFTETFFQGAGGL